jgi:pilus assembly protein CpaE
MTIRFHIYYLSQENGDYLRQALNSSSPDLLVEASSLAKLPAQVASGVDAVLVEYQEDNPQLDRWIEKAASDPKGPPVCLYFPEISTECLWKALRLGVKECFTFPIKGEELQEALQRLLARAAGGGVEQNTHIVSFLGCKGGVGTTFLTANVACLLAQERKGQILVMDLDLRYGQLSYFFDIQPQYSIINVIENLERLDSSYLQSLCFPYDKHLQVLPAPIRLEEAEIVTPEHLEKILSYVKNLRLFPWVLVDAGHHLDEITLKALEMSDEIILVSTPSIPALSNAKKLLELLRLLGLERLKTEFWLNAWQKEEDLTLAEVAKFLGREVSGAVQSDPIQVGRSINEGRPLAKVAQRHPVCRDLKVLAATLMGENPEETDGLGWGWLKLFRRKG